MKAVESKEDKIQFADNSFGAIRLLCCVCIMFSHYCVNVFGDLTIPYKPFLFAGSSLSIFFALCGFLVGPSVLRNSPKDFIKKRILRIYPVYIFTLITTILVADIHGNNYTIIQKFQWFAKELITMRGVSYGGISNGAIWAISIQLQVYIISLLIYKRLHKIESKGIWGLLIVLFLFLNVTYCPFTRLLEDRGFHYIKMAYYYSFIPSFYFFLIGMFVYKFFDDVVPILKKYALLFLAIHLLWHAGFVDFPPTSYYTDPITVITAVIAAIGGAYRFPGIKLSKDFSYDIYCWHMPVITGLSLFLYTKDWMLIILSILITTVLSYLTNRFVEQRMVIHN